MLDLEPRCMRALWMRAQAQMGSGASSAAFLDLRRLQGIDSTWPGLDAALQAAAAAACTDRPPPKAPGAARYQRLRRGSSPCNGAAAAAGGSAGARQLRGEDALRGHEAVLGVSGRATREEVRQAWLRAARANHPDKLAGRPAAELAAAEARFKRAQAAYLALTAQARWAEQ